MLIVSKIQRAGGSRITISGTEYKFVPHEEGGPHLCDVPNEGHAKRLLSITEGFYAFEGGPLTAKTVVSGDEGDTSNTNVKSKDDAGDVDAETAATAAAIDAANAAATADAAAIDASNAAIDEANAAAEAVDTDDGEDETSAEDAGEDAEEGDILDSLSDLDLKQAYKDVFGKKPNGQMLRENIIKSIREHGGA